MAHELGHLVCHTQRVTGSMETEREADAFASAFLVPARTFSREFKSARARVDAGGGCVPTWKEG